MKWSPLSLLYRYETLRERKGVSKSMRKVANNYIHCPKKDIQSRYPSTESSYKSWLVVTLKKIIMEKSSIENGRTLTKLPSHPSFHHSICFLFSIDDHHQMKGIKSTFVKSSQAYNYLGVGNLFKCTYVFKGLRSAKNLILSYYSLVKSRRLAKKVRQTNKKSCTPSSQ